MADAGHGSILTALPNPSSPSTIKRTSAIRVMQRQWSTKSDMLARTMSGTPRLAAQSLASTSGGASLVQHSVAARGRGHQDPVAVLDHLLDIVEGGMEPAVRHLVRLADVQDLLDALQHVRMVVLTP